MKRGLKTDVCSPPHPQPCGETARQRGGTRIAARCTRRPCASERTAPGHPRHRALRATLCGPLALTKLFPPWPYPTPLEGARAAGRRTAKQEMLPRDRCQELVREVVISRALLRFAVSEVHPPGHGEDEPAVTSLRISLCKTCARAPN